MQRGLVEVCKVEHLRICVGVRPLHNTCQDAEDQGMPVCCILTATALGMH